MAERETVKVYSFRVYDADANELRHAAFKARREDIVSRFGGEVLEGTDQQVAAEELDAHGRWRRVATGWGELD